MISSGVVLSARLDHLPNRWVLAGDRGALVVAERVDVEQQSLLDLGVVEQVAEALGSHPGMVRQDDRGAEHRVVARVASTGKVFTLRQASTASPAAPCRSSGETKRPPVASSDNVRGQKAGPKRLRAIHGLHVPGEAAVELCTHIAIRASPGCSSVVALSRIRP